MNLFRRIWATAFGRDEEPTPQMNYDQSWRGSRSAYSSYYSGGAKFPGGLSDTVSPLIDNPRARNAARTAYLDSMHAHAMVHRFTDTVVDIGLQVKPRPAASILGITNDQAADWANDVARRFDLWAKSRRTHRAEQMNFYQLQRLAFLCKVRDGEAFVQIYYNGSDTNPMQMRLVDPSNIQGYELTPTDGTMAYTDGIRRDQRGRPVSYTIMQWNPDGSTTEKVVAAKGRRSGKPMMLHAFQAEWPDQIRGYPRFFHLLQEFQNITDFTTAQIKKAIAQSSIALFNKPSPMNPASNPLLDISQNSPAGTSVTDFYDSYDDTSPSTTISNPVDFIPIQEATIAVPGSVSVFNLLEGEELKPFANTAPAEGFQSFIDTFTTFLSASVGMPAEVLKMKFDQSYSAARGALIMFWRIAQIWRMEFASDLLTPVFQAWLSLEISSGRIKAPGWSDPLLREAWANCQWSGVPMPNIDPMKTAKADQAYVEMGAQTLQDVAHNLNGSNAEENQSQLKRELENLPNPPWSAGAKTAAAKDMAAIQQEQDMKEKEDDDS